MTTDKKCTHNLGYYGACSDLLLPLLIVAYVAFACMGLGFVKGFLSLQVWLIPLIFAFIMHILLYYFGRWLKIEFYRTQEGVNKACIIERHKKLLVIDINRDVLVIRPIEDPPCKRALILFEVVVLNDENQGITAMFPDVKINKGWIVGSFDKREKAVALVKSIFSHLGSDMDTFEPKILPVMRYIFEHSQK